MKNILIALSLAAFSFGSAQAQTRPACELPKGQVCKRSGNNVSCYKTKFANDFKVCKGEYGYFICCEEPTYGNSTHPKLNMAKAKTYPSNPMEMNDDNSGPAVTAMVAPQSQSYPVYAMNSATSYEGYYGTTKKGRGSIKVCYGGDNVAELNRAAYHGCATPAYDGPEANRARNVNSNNTIDDIPPISGQIR